MTTVTAGLTLILSSAPAPLTTDSGGEGPLPFPRSNIDINDPAEANGPESTISLPPALLVELIVLTLSALLPAIFAVLVAVFVALVGLALRLAASVAAMRL
jgi:hypothetical protein